MHNPQDFSEDTYRTLSAADNAVMLVSVQRKGHTSVMGFVVQIWAITLHPICLACLECNGMQLRSRTCSFLTAMDSAFLRNISLTGRAFLLLVALITYSQRFAQVLG
eukprot:1158545-Pelagomonas_calceolata.AAC.3